MAGSIFLRDGDGLRELREAAYDSEALLQGLLASYPQLLAGDQMNMATPRRWLLISREAGLQAAEGGARWAVDHLFLDQEAIPTIIEVKRGTDPRIRREVVGQMLDYAANAVLYWQIDKLRSLYEARCEREGKDPDETLEEFLEDTDPEAFWEDVKVNLQAGRVRLVFVADVIPRELLRIVEFLNGQMDPCEVLALEVRRYSGEGVDTLVPRVLGQTTHSDSKKSGGGSGVGGGSRSAMFTGKLLRIAPDVMAEGNPRVPQTHGWLAFEVLRRAGGRLSYEEYVQRLRNPSPDIAALAKTIPGVPNAYQRLAHLRKDVRLGRILVEDSDNQSDGLGNAS